MHQFQPYIAIAGINKYIVSGQMVISLKLHHMLFLTISIWDQFFFLHELESVSIKNVSLIDEEVQQWRAHINQTQFFCHHSI